MSSNGSNIGYRGSPSHPDDSNFDFIYQVSTAIDMAAAPGLQDTWTKSSNTVQGASVWAIPTWASETVGLGTLKFGTMFLPYKTSTDRLNPFAGQLGDYSTIMGNTGGDNRIEFGTRADHVVGCTTRPPGVASASMPPTRSARIRTATTTSSRSDRTDCYGGNIPGSGNLPLNCDDGGFELRPGAAI